MAIEFNTASSINGNASSYTFGHNVAGTDPILMVYVASKGSLNPLVDTVTFNTTENLTKADNSQFASTMVGEMWYLENPTVTSGNVVVTLLGSQKAVCGAVSYNGVSGINLNNIVAFSGQDTLGTGTITTEVADSIVVVGHAVRDRGTIITIDSDLTQRYQDANVGNPSNATSIGLGLDQGAGVGLPVGSYAYGLPQDATEAWVLTLAELVPAGTTADIVSYGFIM